MCEQIKLGNGDVAIVCGVRGYKTRFCSCGREAVALCDWKVSARSSGTCDAPVCADHAMFVANGRKHLCPTHQDCYELWKKRHPAPQLELFGGAS